MRQGNLSSEQPLGPLSSEQPLGPLSSNQPLGPLSSEQPLGPLSSRQPPKPPSSRQPLRPSSLQPLGPLSSSQQPSRPPFLSAAIQSHWTSLLLSAASWTSLSHWSDVWVIMRPVVICTVQHRFKSVSIAYQQLPGVYCFTCH